MNTFIIDGGNIQTLDDIYDAVEKTFPEAYPYFGRNLDALYDILSDGHITHIVVKNSEILKKNLWNQKDNESTEYDKLFEIFQDITDLEITLS